MFGVGNMTAPNQFMQELMEKIAGELPHGSGIDANWGGELLKNGKMRFYNGYHCMAESGMYEGWQDFVLVVNPLSPQPSLDFELHFIGNQYLAKKHFLREYLDDIFNYALLEIFEKERG